MNNKTELKDFSIITAGYGHYKVTYTSPKTGKKWSRTINNAPLIDSVFNTDQPKRKNLDQLKRLVKTFKPSIK